MRVGILTYHFSENYGALFQAYALRKWFLEQGHDAEFVNYHPDHVEGGGNFQLNNLFSKKNAKVLYLKISTLKRKWLGNKKQKDDFDYFRKHYLGVVEPEYKSISELESAALKFDLLVCGSDQVWNPSEQYGLDPAYFLNFSTSNPNARRISYAPSFGRSTIDSSYYQQLTDLIHGLDGVSVREQSGAEIVHTLLGYKPICVPDPTFLLEDYSHITTPYPLASTKYVFCYGLRSRAIIGSVAESIAKQLNADLYSPYNPHRRWKEIGETVYPCPRQWLYLMRNAEFVVTNSFHGTALAILLNKPFVVVGLNDSKASLNTRALNLLASVGVENRFINVNDTTKTHLLLNERIDWDAVNHRISTLRQTGTSFLNEQIGLASGLSNE